MRRRHQCGRCGKTTVHTAVACVGCGGSVEPIALWRDRIAGRSTLVLVAVLAAICSLALLYSDVYVPAITDWYLDVTLDPQF
jgi:hypothetical protein